MILTITNLINANARIPYATMRLFVVVSTRRLENSKTSYFDNS